MEQDIRPRPYRDEQDWWAIRALLVDTHDAPIPGWNWDVRRWDGNRFHGDPPAGDDAYRTTVALWEDPAGRLLGAVHDDGVGEAVLSLRPEARALEPAMVEWAAANLATAAGDGAAEVGFEVLDRDAERRGVLVAAGARETEDGGWRRRQVLAGRQIQVPALAPAYRLRATERTDADAAGIAALLNAAFRRSIHTGGEYRAFMAGSPSFTDDFNLVAVAPDGSFAAHVGLTLEPGTRHATVEPVCTHPDHRRLGLARVLLLEGLRRVAAAGARCAAVDTGDGEAANALYIDCGFTVGEHLHRWVIPGIARR